MIVLSFDSSSLRRVDVRELSDVSFGTGIDDVRLAVRSDTKVIDKRSNWIQYPVDHAKPDVAACINVVPSVRSSPATAGTGPMRWGYAVGGAALAIAGALYVAKRRRRR